jgi:selenocysteine-specific elongation factor
MRTIGGGVVLNPLGRRMRKPLERYRASLAIWRDGTGADALEALIDLQESLAVSALRAQQLLNAPQKEIAAALKDPRFIKLSIGDEEGFTTRAKWDALGRFALAAVTQHHAAEPLAPGLEMEALRSRLPWEVSTRAMRSIVDRLARETGIVRDDSVLRLATHQVHLGGAAGKLGAQLEQALEAAAFQPPDLTQLVAELKLAPATVAQMRTVAAALEREGKIVKVATDLYFGRRAIDGARERLFEYLAAHPEITAAAFRDLLGASRKFAIAILDYFDHSGVTTRVGDARRLRARTG